MTDTDKLELIKSLRKAKGSEGLRKVLLGALNAEVICLKAADAIEEELWWSIDYPSGKHKRPPVPFTHYIPPDYMKGNEHDS